MKNDSSSAAAGFNVRARFNQNNTNEIAAKVRFPGSPRVIGLSVHVERKIASFQNVFTYQANEGFIAMDMGLRFEQSRQSRSAPPRRQRTVQ